MADNQYPILFFPTATSVDRDGLQSAVPTTQRPQIGRQRARIGPKLETLQRAFEARRLQLQQGAPGVDPELVIVFETAGPVDSFVKAVKKVAGLEWLLESAEDIEPDDDFFDRNNGDKLLNGRLFLVGSNQQALSQIISLWNRYQANPTVQLERGYAPWKDVFALLKDIRFWSVRDRIGSDVIQYWQERIQAGIDPVRFEIDIWHSSVLSKNEQAYREVSRLVTALNGRILSRALISEICYHGVLVELPVAALSQLLEERPPELAFSERVMSFRPRGQSAAPSDEDEREILGAVEAHHQVEESPVVALLDGFPVQNHPMLAGRLIIDDPDGWEGAYSVQDRMHGTAMASLIVHGDLSAGSVPSPRPLYVRPVLRPDQNDPNSPRAEVTPDNVLLVDLMHRAIRRIFEGDGDQPAVAPTVRIINLSLGDSERPFDRQLSPWARLLDWLSFKYRVLFIISVGNNASSFTLQTARESLPELTVEQRQAYALRAVFNSDEDKTILSPAESINGLSIGAIHSDVADFPTVPRRYDLLPGGALSPYSRIGNGFRRAVKPDLLFSGGRILFSESIVGPPETTLVAPLWRNSVAPGHKVACPPSGLASATKYSRGTSNAAALAARSAALAFETIESIRAENSNKLTPAYDAVLLKAMMAHGASWGDLLGHLTASCPDVVDRDDQRKLAGRWFGYGAVDMTRVLSCTQQRATMIGVGELKDGKALSFSAPLPPSLAAKVLWKRLTITLAWLTPTNAMHQAYRGAKLWISPPADRFDAVRKEVDWRQVQRGTLQHEILEGDRALAFVDGERFVCKVNCKADAGKLLENVPFAICVSLEVAEGIDIPLYQEIKDRITPRVQIQG
ncbi:S8 family peptidase [Duganella callida]|nr:S8 family peptidase [Duganella callida]